MTKLQKGAATAFGCLLALLLGSVSAFAQTSFAQYNGVYTIVDDKTGSESLMRLEFIPNERDGYMVATIFANNGRYKVFAGPVLVQGPIAIPLAIVNAAKVPYQVLKRPRQTLMHLENFNQQDQCRFQLYPVQEPLSLGYGCSEQGHQGSSGLATRLRK